MTRRSPKFVGTVETTNVDIFAGDLDLDAAVLRQALLGDVELAHDLDARGDRGDAPSWAGG